MYICDQNDAVIALTDNNYLKHLKTLLASLRSTKHKINVYVCLINIDQAVDLEKELKSIYSPISFKYINKKFMTDADRKAFCSNYRVTFIKEILKNPLESIIYLDADSIVRKEMSLAEVNLDSDIEILFRKSDDDRFKVATGAILVKNNPRSKRFFEEWEKNIQPKIYSWFSDQRTFYKTFLSLRDEVNIYPIDKRLIDWEFKETSIVWAGKGKRKYTNSIYLLEALKLRTNNRKLQRAISQIQSIFMKLRF